MLSTSDWEPLINKVGEVKVAALVHKLANILLPSLRKISNLASVLPTQESYETPLVTINSQPEIRLFAPYLLVPEYFTEEERNEGKIPSDCVLVYKKSQEIIITFLFSSFLLRGIEKDIIGGTDAALEAVHNLLSLTEYGLDIIINDMKYWQFQIVSFNNNNYKVKSINTEILKYKQKEAAVFNNKEGICLAIRHILTPI